MESAKGFAEVILNAGFRDYEDGIISEEVIALVESRDKAIRKEEEEKLEKFKKRIMPYMIFCHFADNPNLSEEDHVEIDEIIGLNISHSRSDEHGIT